MSRDIGVVATIALVVVVLFGAVGGGIMGYGGFAPMHSWGAMGLGWVLMAAFWVAVALGVVALVRSGGRERGESPDDVLRRRFAAGEIDREQYEEMRRVLGDETPRAA
jgi:putative membrane protein